jgi:CTP:molybdopterin cytidylyltransferase MocA
MVIAAILLAADDLRIDGTLLPLLLFGDDQTLIEYHVAQLQAAGVDVVEVVLGWDAERLIPLVAQNDVEPIVNTRWRDGDAGSIRVGATAVPRDTEAAIVVRIDEPRPAEIIRRLLDEHLARGAMLTRAAHGDRAGAPIVVGRAMLSELRNVTDAGGLGAVVARHAQEVADVACADDVVLLRIEDAAGYARALEQLR